MTLATAFGPQGPNFTTVRPPADPAASAGIDTWFKNCSMAGAKDGTFATAAFFNVIIGNLRYLCRQAGVALSDADDTMVYQAIQMLAQPSKVLTAPRTYYVSSVAGNDANDGITLASPFASIQKAVNTALSFNQNGFRITVNVADGSYAPFGVPALNGSGGLSILGNLTTPSNVLVQAPKGTAAGIAAAGVTVAGLKFASAAPDPAAGDAGIGVQVYDTGSVTFYNVDFGACYGSWLIVQRGAFALFDGAPVGSAGNFLNVSGSSGGAGFVAASNASLGFRGVNLNILNAITTGAFVCAQQNGTVSVLAPWNTTSGFANVTGARYLAASNGIIDATGRGTSYFPGSIAGTEPTGGKYLA